MMARQSGPLAALLSPASVAVVGASADRTKIRGTLFHQLVASGYTGRLYPITSSVAEIEGHRCFPSVSAVGEPVDLAIVAIPPEAVMGVLEECAAAGVRSALVLTSGFAEQGGASKELQDRMTALARSSGMRICGPNSVGLFNATAHIAATFSPAIEQKAGRAVIPPSARLVGVISQSGGMGFSFYDYGRPLGLGFSCIVNTGNEADVTAGDLFLHMARDPDTDVIIMFLEGVRDPARFVEAAQEAAEAGKPVMAVKIGRSVASARAAVSHTANMTGWDVAYDAVFRKYGITVAHDPEEMTAIAAAFATCPPARGNRVGIITVSGGGGALMSDVLAAQGLVVPELSPALQREIAKLIPSYGAAANPVDITASGAFDGGLDLALELLAGSDEVDAVVIVSSLASERRVSFDTERLRRVVARQDKPVLVYSYTRPSALACTELAKAGLVPGIHLTWTARAMRALVERGRFQVPARQAAVAGQSVPVRDGMCEYEVKALLAANGIGVDDGRLVSDPVALGAAGDAVGWPVALKIQSPDIPHKSEVGGVALNIPDAAALRAAYDAMMQSVGRHKPAAGIHGVLVQPMAARGVEMIVSSINDPVFGPVIAVGAGGVNTEIYKDLSRRLAPVDATGASEMLAELRSAALLQGWRGSPPADTAALAELVARVSAFAEAQRDTVGEIELNPVLVHTAGQGCTVADALLVPLLR